MPTVGPAFLLLTKAVKQQPEPARSRPTRAPSSVPDAEPSRTGDGTTSAGLHPDRAAGPDLMSEALRRWVSEGGALGRRAG